MKHYCARRECRSWCASKTNKQYHWSLWEWIFDLVYVALLTLWRLPRLPSTYNSLSFVSVTVRFVPKGFLKTVEKPLKGKCCMYNIGISLNNFLMIYKRIFLCICNASYRWMTCAFMACNSLIWEDTADGDNHILNFHLGRYVVRYTFGNHILMLRWRVTLKINFRAYILQYTYPNEKFRYNYPHIVNFYSWATYFVTTKW